MIGITVDHHRRTKGDENLQINALRLKEYQSNLILFPIKTFKPQTEKTLLRKTRRRHLYW